MINKITLIGRICNEIELKELSGDKRVCNLRIATDGWGKDADSDFHDVVLWNQPAEFCSKYADKGMRVYVEGRLTYRKFEDKNGSQQVRAEIRCDSFKLLDRRERSGDDGGF